MSCVLSFTAYIHFQSYNHPFSETLSRQYYSTIINRTCYIFLNLNKFLHRWNQKACKGYAICIERQGDYADKLCTSHLSPTVIHNVINKFPLLLILPRKLIL